MRKTYKNIISLCAVLIFALTISVTAFADPFSISIGIGGASGAGLFGSMAASSGINVSYPSGTDPIQSDVLWNDLNPGVSLSGTKGQKTVTDPQTGIPTVYDYLTVDLQDWLQAQNDYIDEFVSTYSVTDNSSGTINVGKAVNGVPEGSTIYSGSIDATVASYNLDGGYTLSVLSSGYVSLRFPQTGSVGSYNMRNYFPITSIVLESINGSNTRIRFYAQYNNPYIDIDVGQYKTNSYSGSWDSGTVDTSVFDTWHNPMIMIPSSSWTPSDPTNWNPAEFLEELTVKRLQGLSSDITVEDDYNPGPVPPPPLPTTPLGEVPYDDWYEGMGDLIGQGVQDGLGDIEGDLEDLKEETETQTGILDRILNKLGDIADTLEDILTGVLELVQEIVLATETFIAGLLNSIIGGFGGWLSTMKQSFNIWHYVVEWVSSISSVFSWFWSMAGSTSYYIQLPIYASLAGAVVLAFYKRFGR